MTANLFCRPRAVERCKSNIKFKTKKCKGRKEPVYNAPGLVLVERVDFCACRSQNSEETTEKRILIQRSVPDCRPSLPYWSRWQLPCRRIRTPCSACAREDGWHALLMRWKPHMLLGILKRDTRRRNHGDGRRCEMYHGISMLDDRSSRRPCSRPPRQTGNAARTAMVVVEILAQQEYCSCATEKGVSKQCICAHQRSVRNRCASLNQVASVISKIKKDSKS
jgi:hypothetical protein